MNTVVDHVLLQLKIFSSFTLKLEGISLKWRAKVSQKEMQPLTMRLFSQYLCLRKLNIPTSK